MADLRLVELHEREVRLFPRSELIDSDGRSLILPETRELNAIDMRDVADGVQLRAVGIVGYLPLTRHITLNIRPKFPVSNLWHLLSVADDDFERVLPVVRSYTSASEQVPHLLLARAFCRYLKELTTAGLFRSYPTKRIDGFFRPKVAFGPTLTRYVARGDLLRSTSDVFEFSKDLRLNQLIKSGSEVFYRMVPKTEAWAEERLVLDDAIASLTSIFGTEIRHSDLTLAEEAPVRLRDAYRGAIATLAMLRGLTGIGFSHDAAGSELPSFLFKLDDIFEAFARNSIRSNLRSSGISIVDGNIPRNHGSLFEDNKRFPTKPDLIFRRNRKPIMIGEVKYKPKIDESDRYQLISHTLAAGCGVGFWFSPSTDGQTSSIDYVGSVAGKARFYHATLDLSADIETGMRKVSEMILGLSPAEAAEAA